MSLESLPYEIVKHIFEHIDRKCSYYEHLFVSKKWHAMVKPIYYTDVTIVNRNFGWLLQQQFLEEEEFKKTSQYFSSTKKLCIRDTRHNSFRICEEEDIEEDIKKLLLCFKNIRVLDVHECAYGKVILAALSEYSKKNDFPYLEEAFVGKQSDICLEFFDKRPALKTLSVCGVTEESDFIYDMMDTLKRLEGLKKLVINKNDSCSNVTLFAILNNCRKNLSYIDVTTIPTLNDTFIVGKDLRQLITDQELNNTLSRTKHFQHLEVLFLTISSFSMPYINFFTNYCPANLKYLEIKGFEEGFFSWINQRSLRVILELATSLSKVETLIIETNEEDHTTEEIEDRIENRIEDRIDKFYEVLDAIVGHRNVSSCTAQFTNFGDHKVNISIKENSNLFYRYRIKPCDYNTDEIHDPDAEDENYYRMPYIDFFIPTPSFDSSNGPHAINHLDCIIRWRYEVGDFPKDCLQYASENCSSLCTFKMTYFLGGTYPEEKAYTLAARHDNESTGSRLEDMTIVSLADMEFSQALIDVLLIYFFNGIRILEFTLSNRQDSDWNDQAYFNLEEFTYLTSFIVGIDYVLDVYDIKFVYYKFTLGDMERTECFEFVGNKEDTYLKPVSTHIYFRQEKRPCSANYTINIKCEPHCKEFFLGNLSLLKLSENYLDDDEMLQEKSNLIIKLF